MFKVDGWVLATLMFQTLVFVYTNPDLDCDFRNGTCSWSQDDKNEHGQWQTGQSKYYYYGLHNKGKGSYLYMISLDRKHSTLESIKIYINEFQCLTFWYRMINYYNAKIYVHVQERESSRLLKTFTNLDVHNNTWLQAAVEFEVPNRTIITFRVTGELLEYDEIGMDDIAVTPASCLGVFASDTLYRSPRSESVLTSKTEIFPGQKCLSFLHLIQDNCKTYMQVRSYEGVVLFTNWKNISDNDWKQMSISIDLSNKSRIAISFVHGCNCHGQYHIGRISLKEGLCSEAATTLKTIPSAPSCATYTTTTTTTSKINLTTIAATSTSSNSTDVSADNSTIATTATNRDSTRISTMCNDSTQVYAIMATVIGCLVMIVAVLLVAVCYYRRRDSNSRTNSSMNNTGLYETQSGVSIPDNYNQIIRLSSGRENSMSDRVEYNVEPEYITIDE